MDTTHTIQDRPDQILEEIIQQKLDEKRRELESEFEIKNDSITQFRKAKEDPFTKGERGQTKILFGGLTWRHEHLIAGAIRGLGYQCEVLPTPDVAAFQLGKEYGNNGQCNPTYFTVGNLVQYLQKLEQKGMSRKEIIDNHVFLTAGSCGPCRFGMYEAEYRLALRNSGFEGFRVLIFQQSGGLNQDEVEAGLELNTEFFLGLLNAMNVGDMINGLGYQIRPYECKKGETDVLVDHILNTLHDVFKSKKQSKSQSRWGKLLSGIGLGGSFGVWSGFVDQLTTTHYMRALEKVREELSSIELDRFRVKPIVKITGEFWAQTTDGDGNFNMFPFLENEGAEVLIEPVGTWIVYLIALYKQTLMDRKGIDDVGQKPEWWQLGQHFSNYFTYWNRMTKITLAEKLFLHEYNKVRKALGNTIHELVDQYELQRIGHPYYNSRAEGGEGHLEVAKNIYYHHNDLCHMVLSLKPFGCMPSTQSDGAQAAVMEHFKDMIFLPIETSGEGEINAHSRVQMALGNARTKAKREFERALASTGKELTELRAYVENHPKLKSPLYKVPGNKGVVGTAANFVLHVSNLIDRERA